MKRWTLRRRLLAVLVGLLAAAALTTGVLSTLALRNSLTDQLDERVLSSSQRAVDAQHQAPPGEGSLPPGEGDAGPGGPPGLDVPGQRVGTVNVSVTDSITRSGYIDEDGTLQPLTDDQEAALLAVTPGQPPTTVELDELGPYRTVAVTTPDGETVITGVSTSEVDDTVSDYLIAETGIALAGIILATLAGGLLVRRQLRPLEQVAATATRVAELPLHEGQVTLRERVPDRYTDPTTEVGQVGAALNQLLGHVEGALQARHESETHVRQFVADASHELRSPLSTITTGLELMHSRDERDDARLAAMREEAARLDRIIGDLLLLAQADERGLLPRADDVDLDELVYAEQLRLRDATTLRLEVDVVAARIHGDRSQLARMLRNLVDNSARHGNGHIVIRLRPETDGASLEVADDGPGVPLDVRDHIFARFVRLDAGRDRAAGGTGLGLAIVAEVVTAHGGQVEILDAPGGGALFRVRLPDQPPSVAPSESIR